MKGSKRKVITEEGEVLDPEDEAGPAESQGPAGTAAQSGDGENPNKFIVDELSKLQNVYGQTGDSWRYRCILQQKTDLGCGTFTLARGAWGVCPWPS